MPGSPAARLTDLHECPLSGGPILPTCSLNVRTNLLPASRLGDEAGDAEGPDPIIEGSPTVRINSRLAVRVGDQTLGGGEIAEGSPNVRIGDFGYTTDGAKAQSNLDIPAAEATAGEAATKGQPTLEPASAEQSIETKPDRSFW